MLIKPKQIMVKDADGVEHEFTISRLPATVGREVLAKYPTANAPKVGDYETSKGAMLLMMRYVSKQLSDGSEITLTTQALVDNHVPDGEALIRLEIEMLKYNTSFFGSAGSQDFMGFLLSKVEDSLPRIMKTLIRSLQSSLPQDTQR